MHMADALISPLVGGGMWAATAGITAYSARKLEAGGDDRVVPLMGVLGAFIFAAQMINFSIPGTGSSGHLGGGMILSILLGPHAAFLTMASVLTVQALFFADGGLLALGCNIFNLAFLPCFVAYPLLYQTIAGANASEKRILVASLVAVIAGLQLGALAVVLQTYFSGVSELPFATFLLLMLPIHLAIGIVEGLLTAAIVTFVGRARPEVLASAAALPATPRPGRGRLLAQLLLLTAVTGGLLSWFASTRMDGLEWAIFHSSGRPGRHTAGEDGAAARLRLPGSGGTARRRGGRRGGRRRGRRSEQRAGHGVARRQRRNIVRRLARSDPQHAPRRVARLRPAAAPAAPLGWTRVARPRSPRRRGG